MPLGRQRGTDIPVGVKTNQRIEYLLEKGVILLSELPGGIQRRRVSDVIGNDERLRSRRCLGAGGRSRDREKSRQNQYLHKARSRRELAQSTSFDLTPP